MSVEHVEGQKLWTVEATGGGIMATFLNLKAGNRILLSVPIMPSSAVPTRDSLNAIADAHNASVALYEEKQKEKAVGLPEAVAESVESKGQNALAPCPFCGSSDVGFPFDDRVNHWVTCYECESDGPVVQIGKFNPEARAKIRWNRRAALVNPTLKTLLEINAVEPGNAEHQKEESGDEAPAAPKATVAPRQNAADVIPPMTEPLGRYWEQPDLSEIELTDTEAFMDEATLEKLHNYSTSVPTGCYPGKMWRAQQTNGAWCLRWYGHSKKEGFCSNHRRAIILSSPAGNSNAVGASSSKSDDTKRLDWLDKELPLTHEDVLEGTITLYAANASGSGAHSGTGKTYREAIDATMAAAPLLETEQGRDEN